MSHEPGSRIGVYEVLGPLGAGGMGEVYRARDTRLGRVVAVKFLARDFTADRAARERIAREAQLTSSLNHPNIVTVYDVGDNHGHPHIVMELVDGESSGSAFGQASEDPRGPRDRVPGGRRPGGRARSRGGPSRPQTAEHHVHRRRPREDRRFRPGQTDTGQRRPDEATSAKDVLTAEHVVLGSAGYMAPEQVAGPTVDGRADQFALGAVIYEMLSGKRAFQKPTSVQTMAAIIDDDPEPLSALNPGARTPVVTLVERCLSKNRERRYASTHDLARDLHDLRDSVSATPIVRAADATRPQSLAAMGGRGGGPRRRWHGHRDRATEHARAERHRRATGVADAADRDRALRERHQ